jgi:hypothetical protein
MYQTTYLKYGLNSIWKEPLCHPANSFMSSFKVGFFFFFRPGRIAESRGYQGPSVNEPRRRLQLTRIQITCRACMRPVLKIGITCRQRIWPVG